MRSKNSFDRLIGFLLFVPKIIVFVCVAGCSKPVDLNEIDREPKRVDLDNSFSNIFKNWDGTWQGRVYIYEDFGAQKEGTSVPSSPDDFENRALNMAVKETYGLSAQFISKSPFFQRAVMEESFERDGIVSKNQYRGARKVQEGKIYWVFKKNGITFLLQGDKTDAGIVWKTLPSNTDNSKFQTIYEVVGPDSIRIIGWEYNQGEDTSRAPKIWIKADLKRSDNAIAKPKMYN